MWRRIPSGRSGSLTRLRKNPKSYLRLCGATEEECNFLVKPYSNWGGWCGERVELNAMTSDELIAWLERKFYEHGISKLTPDDDILDKAYQRAVYQKRVKEETERIRQQLKSEKVVIPSDLKQQVADKVLDDPELSWDEAIWDIANG